MKILSSEIDWMEKFLNKPKLILTIDEIPSGDDIKYERRDSLYYGVTEDGYVSYFYYPGPGTGYGGATFTLNMKDGSIAELIGPWSSNPGCFHSAGFSNCVEVVLKEDGKRSLYSGSVLLTVAESEVTKHGAKMQKETWEDGDDYYVIVKDEEK